MGTVYEKRELPSDISRRHSFVTTYNGLIVRVDDIAQGIFEGHLAVDFHDKNKYCVGEIELMYDSLRAFEINMSPEIEFEDDKPREDKPGDYSNRDALVQLAALPRNQQTDAPRQITAS